MSRYRRTLSAGATYFFTVVTYQRRQFLCDEDVRIALRQAIIRVRQQYPFRIEACVLLPDHLHTIWTLPENDRRFSLRWQQIKRHVTQQCGERLHQPVLMTDSRRKHRESTLWQRRYWEHQIRDDLDLSRHLDYLHYNPVKHGWAPQVDAWLYSSFHRYVALGMYPQGWGMTKHTNTMELGDCRE